MVESPSLHIGNGRLLLEAANAKSWPRVVYLGVGTEEGDTRATQAEMLANVRKLWSSLRERQPKTRVHLEITAGGVHSYDAWHERLPGALRWLLTSTRRR